MYRTGLNFSKKSIEQDFEARQEMQEMLDNIEKLPNGKFQVGEYGEFESKEEALQFMLCGAA